jgi:hypothetical protein
MLHPLDVKVGDLGSTCRRGDKWAESFGEEIALCVCKQRQTAEYACPPSSIVGQAKVLGIWQGTFFEIPARYLVFEHEVSSRSYGGLMQSMRKAYGKDFVDSERITVVLYRRIS